MTSWKKALIFGSLGAGTVLLLTGKRPAGLALATVGVATLAMEYPEKFEEIWKQTPEYIDRGTRLVNNLTQAAERLAEQSAHWTAKRAKQAREYLA